MNSFGKYVEARRSGAIPSPSYIEQGPSAEGQGEGQANDAELTSYEQARDMSPHVPAAVRRTWVEADRMEGTVRQEVERLIDDETLVPEVKAERARELYESKAATIAEKRRQAKADLQKASAAAYRASIPVYSGQGLSPADASTLLADQQESSRLLRTIENRKSKSGPFANSFPTTDFLREQYVRGLETGGIEGGSIIRGVIRASEELGVDIEDVLSGVRKERHMEYVDKSRLLAHYANMISERVPELPRRTRDRIARLARGSSSASSTTGAYRSSAALVGGGSEPTAKAAPSHSSKRKRK